MMVELTEEELHIARSALAAYGDKRTEYGERQDEIGDKAYALEDKLWKCISK